MRKGRKEDPVERLRGANPVPVEELRSALGDDAVVRARERAIEAGEDPASESRDHLGRDGVGRPWRARLGPAAAVASLAAIASLIVFGGGAVGPGDQPAFAAEAVEIAESNPRLLLGAPGWTVTRADEFEVDHGSMALSNGEGGVQVEWARVPDEYPDPAEGGTGLGMPTLDHWYHIPIGCSVESGGPADDCGVFRRDSEIRVLDQEATLAEERIIDGEGERTSFTTFFHVEPRVELTIRASGLSRAEALEVLDSAYTADVESWLAALPEHVVEPLERPEVVDEMLRDVPIPSSVDVDELKGEANAASRYHLGAAIIGTVACGWLDQWASATRSGDAARAEEAVTAMGTSRDWAILIEMDSRGGWSEVIWEYAEELRRDDRAALLGSGGSETLPGGQQYEVGPAYATGLGCDSERRTLRDESEVIAPPPMPDPIPVSSPH